MSHKDYVKIAGALAGARAMSKRTEVDVYLDTALDAIQAAEDRLASILADDNPRFDRARFHAAAIGEPTTWRDHVR